MLRCRFARGARNTRLPEIDRPNIGWFTTASRRRILSFSLLWGWENGNSATGGTEIERADLETVISDLLRGEFNAPVRVVAFNTLEHWVDDVSRQFAEEVQIRCDIEGDPVPEHIRDFIESHAGPIRQLALRFGS